MNTISESHLKRTLVFLRLIFTYELVENNVNILVNANVGAFADPMGRIRAEDIVEASLGDPAINLQTGGYYYLSLTGKCDSLVSKLGFPKALLI